MMRSAAPLLLASALACAGCSKTAQSRAGESADAIAADVNATAAAAVEETSRALDAASVKIDNADEAAAQAARTGDRAARAASRASNRIAAKAHAARDAEDRTDTRRTGDAM